MQSAKAFPRSVTGSDVTTPGKVRLPLPLHAATISTTITTPVARIVRVVVVRRPSLLRRHLDASGERQQDEHRGEPPMQVHSAATGSIRLGSLFFTLPTRALTGQHVISSGADGAK